MIGSNGHIVLTDFGLSKIFDENDNGMTQTFCGTAEYLAPEVLLGEAYTFTVDYWSLGTLLYEMLAGVVSCSLLYWYYTHVIIPLVVPLYPLKCAKFNIKMTLDPILGRDSHGNVSACT